MQRTSTKCCAILISSAKHSKSILSGLFQIESTDYCNSKCIMCEHYFTHNKQAEILSMETLEHMRDAIQLSRRINLNGMGEPFISKLVNSRSICMSDTGIR